MRSEKVQKLGLARSFEKQPLRRLLSSYGILSSGKWKKGECERHTRKRNNLSVYIIIHDE
jgi:hypothetical protein